MDLAEFQKHAVTFAAYTQVDGAITLYPSLGIVGECGEVTEKIKKMIRDDNWIMTQDRREEIAKELGDCCWYLANICNDIDRELSLMCDMTSSSMLHHIRNLKLPQLTIHMNRHAVLIACRLQDWYYECNSRRAEYMAYEDLPNHISNVITCITEIATICGFTLSEICQKNIDKLTSRKKRNKLSGSGDSR